MKFFANLLVVLSLAIANLTFAQNSNEKPDSLALKKVAKELCGCFKDIKVDDNEDVMNKPQTKDCMSFILFKYRKELKTSYAQLNEADYTPEIGEKISRKQGMRAFPYLLRECPIFFELLVQQAEKDLERYEQYEKEMEKYADTTENREDPLFADTTMYEEPRVEEEVETSEYSAKGNLKKIETKGYTYLIITNEQGQDQSFLWLYSFEGAEKIQNEFKKYKGKPIKVYWYENSVYDAKKKQYINSKQISWIEFLE